MPYERSKGIWRRKPTIVLVFLTCFLLAVIGSCPARVNDRDHDRYFARLFNRSYALDTPSGLDAYIRALDESIARSKREEPEVDAHKKDPLHHLEPKNYIEKKLRKAMETARKTAADLQSNSGKNDGRLLDELAVMADGIQGSFARVLPSNMDAFTAYRNQGRLRHPRVGLGNAGHSVVAVSGPIHASISEPAPTSSLWHEPGNIAAKDLYLGFGRESLPDVKNIICTYQRSKQSKGVHGGFDVKCGEMGKAKLKFGEEYSQPFGHRILWALGYNVPRVDCVPEVKVKWDPRILTEFNTREDESFTVSLMGIAVHHERLQPYLDPMASVRAVVMIDEKGKETTLRPSPTWDDFKKQLFKNPRGRPETKPGNFNESFAARIQYFVYRNVNFRPGEDEEEEDLKSMGRWDWNSPLYANLREDRGFVFISGWINQFDSWVHNNKLFMTGKKGGRQFEREITDLGGCLGPAVDSGKMVPQDANGFPWSFTRPAVAGDRRIPFDGSFHNIRENRTFLNADIDDAKWAARLIAQLTGKQILAALMASGMPSAEVRLFYDKLVRRRNKALADLDMAFTPIKPMDEREDFDYNPHKDGVVKITNSRGETVSAPDDGSVVVKGRLMSRQQTADSKRRLSYEDGSR